MLKRFVIFNSKNFSIADISLDDCNALQIVGSNNAGKSTLIYALNFLYIIDKNQMHFDGKGAKETYHHYFPNIDDSYIVFHIHKKLDYCILVKRNTDDKLEYYKISHGYNPDFFIQTTTDNQQRIRKFSNVLEILLENDITHEKFKSNRDVFHEIYQKGKRNDALVWLENDANSDGRNVSNSFSKIYKYIINTKLLDNKAFKHALTIADNKEHACVTFSKSNQRNIEKLEQHNDKIQRIESIKTGFESFKELVNDNQQRENLLSELVYVYDKQYKVKMENLHEKHILLEEQFQSLSTARNEHDNKKNKIVQETGRIQAKIEQSNIQKNELEKLINKITQYEPLGFLKAEYNNLDQQRASLESTLTQSKSDTRSVSQLEYATQQKSRVIKSLQQRIDNYNSQLIHKLTDTQADKEKLNFILSSDFGALPAGNIIKKISKLTDNMTLFDGIVTLPDNVPRKQIDSIVELRQQFTDATNEQKSLGKLLEVAQDKENKENKEKELKELQKDLAEIYKKIDEIHQLPTYKDNLILVTKQLKEQTNQENELISKSEKITVKITELNIEITEIQDNQRENSSQIDTECNNKREIEELNIFPTVSNINESIDSLYTQIIRENKLYENNNYKANQQFESLKLKTNSMYADKNTFIKEIDEEISTLEQKRGSVEKLLEAVATEFANPCRSLIQDLETFTNFIHNSFNSQLKKVQISDLTELKIKLIINEKKLQDLTKISEIQSLTASLFLDDQNEGIELLKSYLDNQESVNLIDLFDIELTLQKGDDHKKVDFRKQIESNGTDRMVRLIIIMMILSYLVVKDKDNKIVLFVDEIGTIDPSNQAEILKFCQSIDFLPISAAPKQEDGFDKYYLLKKGVGKKSITAHSGITIKREVLA